MRDIYGYSSTATLEQRLRFIDLTFECIEQAKSELIAAGEISALDPFMDELPTPRGKRIAKEAIQLRIAAMQREGLPLSLLGTDAGSEAA